VGPPLPPTDPIKFTPDNDNQAPKTDSPGTLTTPGQPPMKGVFHPPPYPGAPSIFTPFTPSTFTPSQNPTSPIKGTSPPPSGSGSTPQQASPGQPIPFNPDNPGQVSPGAPPQRGTLTRPGSPDTPGQLLASTEGWRACTVHFRFVR
jgi:hypothetical protein